LSDDCNISHSEYIALLTGISPDTPLGRIVSIRAETDSKVISEFTSAEKRIRREWIEFRSKNQKKENREKERNQTNREICEFVRSIFG